MILIHLLRDMNFLCTHWYIFLRNLEWGGGEMLREKIYTHAPCLASEYMGGWMFRVENILYFYTWQVFIAVYFKTESYVLD